MCCATVMRSSGSVDVPRSNRHVLAGILLANVSVAFGCCVIDTFVVLLTTGDTFVPANAPVKLIVKGPPAAPVTATLPLKAWMELRLACTAEAEGPAACVGDAEPDVPAPLGANATVTARPVY